MNGLDRARERETIRYYETWLESRRGYLSPKNVSRDHPSQYSGNEATRKISRDKALVAFAQLGCLRLNAKRGIVTLLTNANAYILAEATQTVSLLAGGQHADGDELWFGTASIPRSQGISEHALNPQAYTAKSPDGQDYTAPALILADVTQDPRFSAKGWAGRGVTFYAGVPIVSPDGFAIGVFNVTDDKPRPAGLTSEELHFMQDVASTVMDHLENIRNDTARHRGERLVLGLGAFTEGRSSLDGDHGNIDAMHETPSQTSSTGQVRTTFKGFTISDTAPDAPISTLMEQERTGPTTDDALMMGSPNQIQARTPAPNLDAAAQGVSDSSKFQSVVADTEAENGRATIEFAQQHQSSHSLEYRRTFSRAANVLCQCTESDGVMFFDASSASIGGDHQGFFGVRRSNSNESTTSSDEAHSTPGGSGDELGEPIAGYADPKAHSDSSLKNSKVNNCELLGFSFQKSSAMQTSDVVLKESEMRRFLRRYPKGMVMHFTSEGDVSSSEEGSAIDRAVTGGLPGHNEKKRAIARELIKLVPGARNVIWLPLWDFSRARWAAGCFIWTSRPGRLLSAQEDLVYLKAFANTIMNEISKLEAIASDHAKTSFVANISHELRSPLHGILGSIEFLQDTAIDAFQASMITTVETCSKTLLDTVNHVLDFAKLPQRSRQDRERSNRSKIRDKQLSSLEEDVDLSRLVEEVVESVYAGQTFRSTGAFYASEDNEVTTRRSLRDRESTQELAQRTLSKFSGAMQVLLDVERLDNWFVRTKPGAIRRIVMNLFGNALKYTEQGLVCVSLSSTGSVSRDQGQLGFRITVTDTGKGMSADFSKHHAWKAFSQEDSFASGIGLGLSIVREITSSMGGETALRSQKDRGTVVSVTITAPRATPPGESSDPIKAVSQRLIGMKLCLLKPEIKKFSGVHADANARAEANFNHMVSSWFAMDVFSSKAIAGTTADFYLYMEPPPTEHLLEQHGIGTENTEVPLIVISPNAFESAILRKDIQKLKDLGRTIEIISQPCGPTKFAMAIEHCLDRGYYNAPPDITSPLSFEGNKDDIIAAMTQADFQARPAMYEPATSRLTEQDEVPEQRESYLQSGLSSPSSDVRTGTITGSIDAQMLSEAGTNTQSASIAGEGKENEQVKSTGPVLLVDDNEVNLKLLVAFVRKAKYTYETATDGSEALNMYKEASHDPERAFQAIVMDIQMPVMDGITATKEIRAFEQKSRVEHPAIIMALTGLASESTKAECMNAGMDHFLAKPVKFKEFLKLLKTQSSSARITK